MTSKMMMKILFTIKIRKWCATLKKLCIKNQTRIKWGEIRPEF